MIHWVVGDVKWEGFNLLLHQYTKVLPSYPLSGASIQAERSAHITQIGSSNA